MDKELKRTLKQWVSWLSFIIFAFFFLWFAHSWYDDGCLKTYAEDYCESQGMIYPDRTETYSRDRHTFTCHGQQEGREVVSVQKEFNFLPEEKEDCKISDGWSFKK